MATIGGDRDKLLRAFLSNSRRKRKNGRVNVTTPQKGEGENTTFTRSSARRPPPPDGSAVPRYIPGYGQVQKEQGARKIGQYQAANDRTVNPLHQRNQYGPYMRPRVKRKPRNRPTIN